MNWQFGNIEQCTSLLEKLLIHPENLDMNRWAGLSSFPPHSMAVPNRTGFCFGAMYVLLLPHSASPEEFESWPKLQLVDRYQVAGLSFFSTYCCMVVASGTGESLRTPPAFPIRLHNKKEFRKVVPIISHRIVDLSFSKKLQLTSRTRPYLFLAIVVVVLLVRSIKQGSRVHDI